MEKSKSHEKLNDLTYPENIYPKDPKKKYNKKDITREPYYGSPKELPKSREIPVKNEREYVPSEISDEDFMKQIEEYYITPPENRSIENTPPESIKSKKKSSQSGSEEFRKQIEGYYITPPEMKESIEEYQMQQYNDIRPEKSNSSKNTKRSKQAESSKHSESSKSSKSSEEEKKEQQAPQMRRPVPEPEAVRRRRMVNRNVAISRQIPNRRQLPPGYDPSNNPFNN